MAEKVNNSYGKMHSGEEKPTQNKAIILHCVDSAYQIKTIPVKPYKYAQVTQGEWEQIINKLHCVCWSYIEGDLKE